MPSRTRAKAPTPLPPRPTLIPLVGHEGVLARIQIAMRSGRLGHAYLFVGPTGVGKRRLGLHLAQSLLCEKLAAEELAPCGSCAGCAQVLAGTHPDLASVSRPEGKTELPIALIQDLVEKLSLKPARGRHKVAIVDHADDLNEESANCFLKTLEEPPAGSLLILLATHAETQLPTIQSRCQMLHFHPLLADQVAGALVQLGVAEDQVEAKERARLGGGSIGLAIEMADATWKDFANRMRDAILQPRFDVAGLTEATLAFVDEAGKESASKRDRASKVVARVATLLDETLRAAVERSSSGHVAEAAHRWGVDAIVDMIDRSIEAERHIGRMANLPLTLETWLDDLARIVKT